MAWGASFNDTLLYQVFTSISDEARVKYRQAREAGNYKRYTGLTFWTPNINIFRDPRWGRGQETHGEDPYLTSRMGLSVVNGLQGPQKILNITKHTPALNIMLYILDLNGIGTL